MLNIHYTIYVVNFGLRAQHPTASKWYTWPLMECKVVPFYYGSENGKQVKILSTGNMISWYLTAACVRSEEHTSELQSLMRISYAVFCLKKKQQNEKKKKYDAERQQQEIIHTQIRTKP